MCSSFSVCRFFSNVCGESLSFSCQQLVTHYREGVMNLLLFEFIRIRLSPKAVFRNLLRSSVVEIGASSFKNRNLNGEWIFNIEIAVKVDTNIS